MAFLSREGTPIRNVEPTEPPFREHPSHCFLRPLACFLACALLLSGVSFSLAATPEKRAVELTFLKSNPGQRDNLRAFITANWFAMDKDAKDQGLMSAFTIFDAGTDEGSWNLLVAVTYTDERGYEGIAEAFEKIRRAHATVRVEGKTLRELGAIVESRTVFEVPALGLPNGGAPAQAYQHRPIKSIRTARRADVPR